MKAVVKVMALLFIVAMTCFPTKIYADTNCQAIYGGGQTCTSGAISVEKDVVNPATNNDVHDLGVTDPQFAPNSIVTFHITVRNTGNDMISSTKVVDRMPQFVTFANGPGSFDTNLASLTFYVGALAPNQAQTFTVTARVVDANHLPPNQTTCLINQVSATSNDQQTAEDSSQFCVTPPGVSVSSSQPAVPQPVTSPATGASPLLLLGLAGLGGIGITLKNAARKEQI